MMTPRIGGRSTASPFDYICQSGSQSLRFPFNAQRGFYFFSARYALAGGIQALGIKAGDNVLLPSYSCGVEIDPFIYYGIHPRFYRIGYDLKADLDDLRQRLTSRVKAVLVTHFLGFPQPIEDIRRICEEKKVFLIEDCAHALLSCHETRTLGTFGDIAIFSLLKTLPVPNGGLLVINNENVSFDRQFVKPNCFASLYYLADLWRQMTSSDSAISVIIEKILTSLCWRCMNALKLGIAVFYKIAGKKRLSLVRPDSFEFAPEIMDWNISSLSTNLVNNTDLDRVKEAR
ncbi:MAG TPA: DegT/DnrJ/EryC1/StrS family aminotransferase, partial [Alphaproteobacteria bacterium]|nr:DegT/DnrJ/EryC1/StrS family aminotransferase [Alphaproteobacteria bacterium]